MSTLFVSDVHLHADRPEMVAAFLAFLDGPAREADALYILGDLFDIWLGDDDNTPPYPNVLAALNKLTQGGTTVTVMHGNRDFLIGEGFTEQTGCNLIPDAAVIDLHGTKTLIMHGDTLCTDDLEYQNMRVHMRDPQWQQQMLSLPLEQRRGLGKGIRDEAKQRSSSKKPEIMDVTQSAVIDAMTGHGVLQMIHGHTHRPAIHEFQINGQAATRIVLGDWYEDDSVLICDSEGCRAVPAGLVSL